MNWYSLYLPSESNAAVAEALCAALTSAGYTLYNPFGLIPGLSYRASARLFVAPPRGGWTRVIAAPEHLVPVAPALSAVALCVEAGIDSGVTFAAYASGARLTDLNPLAPCLRPGRTPDELKTLLAQPLDAAAEGDAPDLPLDALPDDARGLADKVNLKQASGLFNRLSEGLAKRAGGTGSEDAARALLRSHAPDWNSPAGRRLRALMACLTVPDGWHTPDFLSLRDAYQLYARRQRSPNADLYPGDSEAMAAVPDALDYTPVYGGRNA
jgi:hypothetical protein